MSTFVLRVISPDETIELSVVKVVVPCVCGDVGILKGHMGFQSAVHAGVVVAYGDDGSLSSLYLLLLGGFINVLNEPHSVCVVAAERLIVVKEVSLIGSLITQHFPETHEEVYKNLLPYLRVSR